MHPHPAAWVQTQYCNPSNSTGFARFSLLPGFCTFGQTISTPPLWLVRFQRIRTSIASEEFFPYKMPITHFNRSKGQGVMAVLSLFLLGPVFWLELVLPDSEFLRNSLSFSEGSKYLVPEVLWEDTAVPHSVWGNHGGKDNRLRGQALSAVIPCSP